MNDYGRVKKGFDFISSSYDFLVSLIFGSYLLKLQSHFLKEFKDIPSVLIVGGGNGELLLNMLKQNCFNKCVYVDISEKMILHTKIKVKKQFPHRLKDVEFFCCAAENFHSKEKFDAIFFPFLLDCLNEETINKVILKSKNQMTKNGFIVVSEFNTPPNNPWWAFVFSKCLMFVLYLFFNVTCKIGLWKLPGFRKHFALHGFHLRKEIFLMKKILVTQIYAPQQSTNFATT